jgi:peptide/nickel transport system ATP-binding protein
MFSAMACATASIRASRGRCDLMSTNLPAEPVLDIRGLTVRLPAGADRPFAIEDVTIAVRPRELVCVVGESGSGKSVTALATMGLLAPQLTPAAGSIRLDGEELLEARRARLRALRGSRMSMIFQEPMTALNPVMTAGQQIDEVLSLHSDLAPGARTRRILEVMAEVNLPEPERLRHAYPHQLSGGQRQRVMIAMALALNPRLLIADEPTTALDVTTQAQILGLIKRIQREHDMGVLFITHDFGVVAEVADRVAVMQNGRIVETGDTTDILSTPRHGYTRMLITAVPSLVPRHREARDGAPIVLATHGLAKTYGGGGFFQRAREVRAASDVDIAVRRGETLGIVGESGSGKTTVARCLVRLVEPTDGRIELHGRDIGGLRERPLRRYRKQIQIIFQDPYRSLNPRRTVGQSIVEGPTNYGVPRAQARLEARELLELVSIDPGALDRYPHQFSGGQRQRIAIARALAMRPDVLVADEAVSALDVSVQAQVLDLLDDIRRRFDLAIVFITHDLRVAAQICDTIAVMYQGEVVEAGRAAEVFANPRHDYTRTLFNAAPGRHWNFSAFRAA